MYQDVMPSERQSGSGVGGKEQPEGSGDISTIGRC